MCEAQLNLASFCLLPTGLVCVNSMLVASANYNISENSYTVEYPIQDLRS